MPTTNANAIDATSNGLVTQSGTAVGAASVTQYDVLLGGSTSTSITNVSPGASGAILQSQGSSSDPAWSTATYPSTTLGTYILYSSASNTVGQISPTDYGVMVSNNSSVPSMLGNSSTTGYVLTANTGAAPSWQAVPSGINQVNMQVFTSSGTYTPTSGMLYCIIEMVGGGGAGGGAPSGYSAGFGSGGGGGQYAKAMFSASAVGASQTATVGSGGSGVSGSSGSSGGTSSIGSLLSAGGGTGGSVSGSNSTQFIFVSGAGGGTGGSSSGQTGAAAFVTGGRGYDAGGQTIGTTAYWTIFGDGGRSAFGFGASTTAAAQSYGGNLNYNGTNAPTGGGGGGSGAVALNSASASTGGNGAKGVIIITEFI